MVGNTEHGSKMKGISTMNNITDLLKTGESEQIEFKPSLSQKDNIMATISAFSNTYGGIKIIGVSDIGKPMGMGIEKNTMANLANQIKQNTDPAIIKQFFRIKYIEEVGTGTNNIIVKCIDFGLPEPEFKCTAMSLVFTL